MKKVVINLILILTIFIIYFLQANFFSWFNISGIMPNIFVIFALFVGLFASKTMGTIYGTIAGLIVDLSLNNIIGINAICLGIIGFLAGIFDKNFSKDNRMIIIFMVFGTTIIFEVLKYITNYIFIDINVELISFIRILSVEAFFNILIAIIIYPIIQKAGYYIENTYKGNKILTRYF